jgi:hypothetical protein
MISDQPKSDLSSDVAWMVLEAANDFGDDTTIEACRRVIDAPERHAGRPIRFARRLRLFPVNAGGFGQENHAFRRLPTAICPKPIGSEYVGLPESAMVLS